MAICLEVTRWEQSEHEVRWTATFYYSGVFMSHLPEVKNKSFYTTGASNRAMLLARCWSKGAHGR